MPKRDVNLRIVVTDVPLYTCGRCHGHGEVAWGNSTTMWLRCPACKGVGQRA